MLTGLKVTATALKNSGNVIQKNNTSRSLPAAPVQFERELKDDTLQLRQKELTVPFSPVQKKENKTGLPDDLKTGIENLSGFSMDDVKVHYNSDKPAQLNALAYAQGTDIHVAPAQEKHLPHEAWHVVQQKQGRVKATMQMKGVGINDDNELEKEADVMGNTALLNRVNYKADANRIMQPKKDIIQAKKTKPVQLPKRLAARYFNHSDYKDLTQDDQYGQFVYDGLRAVYNESLKKGSVYWDKLQDAIKAFKEDDNAAFVSESIKKRKEYDQKFQKNYVTKTNKFKLNPTKKELEVSSSGLAADGDKVNPDKDIPYANSVSFVDNSITAAHNYAERDEARIADEKNKDTQDYEKRGLPNSEILWQQYKAAAQTQFRFSKQKRANNLVKDLSMMKRRQVQNYVTQQTILFALPDTVVDFDQPHTWNSSEEEFKAVLGTPNCSGAAHLLADHVVELNGKSITDIQLMGGQDVDININFG